MKEFYKAWRQYINESVGFGGVLPGMVGTQRSNVGTTVSPHKASNERPGDDTDTAITVKACLHRNSMVLLLKNEKGWDLPGGHLKQGEGVEDGLRREVYEETGLNIEDVDMVNSPTGRKRFFCAAFMTDDVHLSNEHTEFKFFHKDEIADLEDLDETFRSVILKCLGGDNRMKKHYRRIKVGVKII